MKDDPGERLLVGTLLRGYCNGCFGSNSYEEKRVEAVGIDWVVAREVESGLVEFATGDNIHARLIESQRQEESDGQP